VPGFDDQFRRSKGGASRPTAWRSWLCQVVSGPVGANPWQIRSRLQLPQRTPAAAPGPPARRLKAVGAPGWRRPKRLQHGVIEALPQADAVERPRPATPGEAR